MIQAFISFLLLIIVAAMLIVSWYGVTRGEEGILPDGTKKRYGKIFRGFYFFWFYKTGEKKIYYTGEQLDILYQHIKKLYNGHLMVGTDLNGIPKNTIKATPDFLTYSALIRTVHNVEIELVTSDPAEVTVRFYQPEPIYRFPEKVRDVMAGCITCMPTIYWQIVYVIFILSVKHTVFYHSLFGVFTSSYTGVIVVWLAGWLATSFLCNCFFKLYKIR